MSVWKLIITLSVLTNLFFVFASYANEFHIVTKSLYAWPAVKVRTVEGEIKFKVKDRTALVLDKDAVLEVIGEKKIAGADYKIVREQSSRKLFFAPTESFQEGTSIAPNDRTVNITSHLDLVSTTQQTSVLSNPLPLSNTCPQSPETIQTSHPVATPPSKIKLVNYPKSKIINEAVARADNRSEIQKVKDEMAWKEFRPLIRRQFKRAYGKNGLNGKSWQTLVVEFEDKVVEVSRKNPITISDILHRTNGESSFYPLEENSSRHVGLYQFGEDSAEHLGTSTEQILEMTPAEQLDLFVRYAKIWGDFLYSSHVLPVTSGWDSSTIVGTRKESDFHLVPTKIREKYRKFTPKTFYDQNFVFDMNDDGIITIQEINLYGAGIRREKKRK